MTPSILHKLVGVFIISVFFNYFVHSAASPPVNVVVNKQEQEWPKFEFLFEFKNLTQKVKEGENFVVRGNVSTNSSVSNFEEFSNTYSKLLVTTLQKRNAVLMNATSSMYSDLEWSATEDRWIAEFQFEGRGIFVGYSKFELNIFDARTNSSRDLVVYHVAVVRTDTFRTLSDIFTYTMTVLICLNTFVMGLQLNWKIILAVMKRPIAPVIGFCCQFLIMPVLAFLWASLLLPEYPYLQFGYFAIGCAPGGGNSNFWTLLLDGNLDLSVTMTFCSNMAALAMMPFWLFTLGQVFFKNLGGHIAIPFWNIIVSLVLLIVPCFLGILTTHFRPKWQEKSKKVVRFTTLFVIIVAICFGTASNIYVYSLITAKTLLCGVLLPYGGFGLSYLVAFICRQNHVNCRTIAIETGIQNAGVAILLLNFSLPHPVSDLALVMPVCVLIFTPLPLVFAFVGKCIYKRYHKDDAPDRAATEKEMEVLENAPGKIKKMHSNVKAEKTPMI